jgi:predicted transcriptional regulator
MMEACELRTNGFNGFKLIDILAFAIKNKGWVKTSSFRKFAEYYDPVAAKDALIRLENEGYLTSSKPRQVYIYTLTQKGLDALEE